MGCRGPGHRGTGDVEEQDILRGIWDVEDLDIGGYGM